MDEEYDLHLPPMPPKSRRTLSYIEPERLAALLAAEAERDELLSAEHASVLVAERDNYKAGYEAKTTLIHELVAALTRSQAALVRALTESGHTKFCRAYQDIGDCDCWYGEAWAIAGATADQEATP